MNLSAFFHVLREGKETKFFTVTNDLMSTINLMILIRTSAKKEEKNRKNKREKESTEDVNKYRSREKMKASESV